MITSVPLLEKTFKGDSYKESFLKANKWIATNVLANSDDKRLGRLLWKIEKLEDFGKVKMTLYTSLDTSEEKSHFCKMCKEYHKSFFINEDYNCARCNLATYLKRVNSKITINKSYVKEQLWNKLE